MSVWARAALILVRTRQAVGRGVRCASSHRTQHSLLCLSLYTDSPHWRVCANHHNHTPQPIHATPDRSCGTQGRSAHDVISDVIMFLRSLKVPQQHATVKLEPNAVTVLYREALLSAASSLVSVELSMDDGQHWKIIEMSRASKRLVGQAPWGPSDGLFLTYLIHPSDFAATRATLQLLEQETAASWDGECAGLLCIYFPS